MSDIIPTEEVEDTPLGHDQLGDIKSYLNTLGRTNITELGQVLGLRYATLRDLPHGGFLNEVMTLWLGEADDVLKKGKPSWRSLVQGLRNDLVRQNGIANKIAKEHPTQGQLTPKYRGPPSSQGSGGPAPSSTSLQEKLMTVLTNEDLPVLQEKLANEAHQWYTIGIQLVFDPGVLKGIRAAVRGDVKSGLEELLTLWLQRKQPPSTLKSLIDVVGGNVIKNQALAEQLKRECGDFPSIRNKTCLKNFQPQERRGSNGQRTEGAGPDRPKRAVVDSDEPSIGKGRYRWIGGVLVSAVLVLVVAVVWGLLTTPAHPPPEPPQKEPYSSPKHHPPPPSDSPTIPPSPEEHSLRTVSNLPGTPLESHEVDDVDEHSKDYLRGLNVIGEISVLITSKAQTFHWAGYGLKLHIPQGAIPVGSKQCELIIKVGISGQFRLPKNTSLVSAVYWLQSENRCEFSQPIIVELQHCATSSSRLSFAKWSDYSFPYDFETLEEGDFSQDTYGSIQLRNFSVYAIFSEFLSWILGADDIKYRASIYYLWEKENQRKIHFVITKDLEAHTTVVKKHYNDSGAIVGPHRPVEFEASNISLELPSKGVTLEEGWRLLPLFNPEITKENVDSFKSGQGIPSCQIRADWTKHSKPSQLTHKVTLKGTKNPNDYFYIELDPIPPDTTGGELGHDQAPNFQNKNVDGTQLEKPSKPKFLGSERTDLLKQINPVPFQQTDEKALQLFADQVVLILHTCNANEYCAALEKLEPPTKEDGSKIGDRPIIYPQVGSVIGWFAGYRAAVVRTGQGNKCRYDLTTALTKSFQKGRVIIGAGIAYANNRERKFADVLISNQIENFVQYKIVNGDVTNRGPREEIALNVQRVFENPARDWTDGKNFHCADDGRTSAAHIGCIVSAPTLIRDEVLRDQLMKHTPNAIGGEMEGWVLLELKKTLKGQHNKDIEIIIIKGVADYGDLSKGDEWQWTAAKAAMDCIHYCLNQTGGREFGAAEIPKKEGAQPQTGQPQLSSQPTYQQTGSSTHAAGMQQQPGTQYPPHHPSTGPLAQGASYQATVLNPDDLGELEVCLRSIAADWDKLARQLRMGQDVPNIRKTPGLIDNQGYLGELLDRWLNGDQSTLQILYQALDNLREITTQKAAVNKAITKLEEFQRNRAGRGD